MMMMANNSKKVGKWRWIFKWMSTVGIKESTSVCAKLLNGNL